MPTTPLVLVAEMEAVPGKAAALREILLSLLEPTRKEEGCIQYLLHESNETEGKFLFYEVWASKAHLDAHGQTPHLKRLLDAAPELLVGGDMSLRFFSRLD